MVGLAGDASFGRVVPVCWGSAGNTLVVLVDKGGGGWAEALSILVSSSVGADDASFGVGVPVGIAGNTLSVAVNEGGVGWAYTGVIGEVGNCSSRASQALFSVGVPEVWCEARNTLSLAVSVWSAKGAKTFSCRSIVDKSSGAVQTGFG